MSTAGDQSIFSGASPGYFTIAPEIAFLPALARALSTSLAGGGPEALSDAVIYVPTRRAARTLAETFAAEARAKATLLPKIRTLGDIEEDVLSVFPGAPEDEIDLPPAVSAIERRITLARLVAARDRAFSGHERWAGALAAAEALGKLLDSLYTEEVAPEALSGLVPDALAEHWRQSLRFLEIVTESWPAHLEAIGRMDPAQRRHLLIDRQRRHYEERPPQTPVIVAGTTGSAPAVARLIKTTAQLPMGCVVFPGLDLEMNDVMWKAVDDPHPQSGLKDLLRRLRIERRAVRAWPAAPANPPRAQRPLIDVALRPAEASDSWLAAAGALQETISDDALAACLSLVEAAGDEAEADAIALAIRESLKTPGRTSFLVTPDRDLARRVAMKLRRWDILIDDSAGAPLANAPVGIFLRLVAAWLAKPGDGVALAALLNHPLFGGSVDAKDRRRMIERADLALRGLKTPHGLAGIGAKLRVAKKTEGDLAALADLLARAHGAFADAGAALAGRLGGHLAAAEMLAASADEAGQERLWTGEDGEAAAARLAETGARAGAIDDIQTEDYPDIFAQLISDIVIRTARDAHPRAAILGPLEARLQSADLVILGGLNEGVWPKDDAIDPFLSRGMKRDAGLASPERRLGLSAHDFAQLAAAPSVLLTRSQKSGGKPTTPSRWIVRLKNILSGAKRLKTVDRTAYYAGLGEHLHAAEPITIAAPAPKPPLEARPKQFFVTHIEKLIRDPYAIYAKKVLGLRKLDEIDEAFDRRHVGMLFHAVFERFAREAAPQDEDDRLRKLFQLFDDAAGDLGVSEAHLVFWRARAADAFEWFAPWDAERRQEGAPAVIEDVGRWSFPLGARNFELAAKADRIDLLSDGAVAIFDYKTGAPPPTDKQAKAFNPQLPLTALIACQGGFEALGEARVDRFEYHRVLGRKGSKDDLRGAAGADCEKAIAEAHDGLTALLGHFNDPDAAYLSQPRAHFVDAYGDFDHLARRRERRALGDVE
ncbi:MAG: double-strand break repair protein AddB [Pseudomonadota bacterium]